MNATVKSRIIRHDQVDWRKLLFIQHQGFKDLSPEDRARLRTSLLANDFTQAFYVWEARTGVIYCLDGFHRIQELHNLAAEGVEVPELLPANFVACSDKEEAAKLVLLYSSQYARITQTGFDAFLEQYNLNLDLLKMQVSLPGITDMPQPDILPFPDQLIDDPKNKPAVMKITFRSAGELEEAKHTIETVLQEIAEGYIISVSAGEI